MMWKASCPSLATERPVSFFPEVGCVEPTRWASSRALPRSCGRPAPHAALRRFRRHVGRRDQREYLASNSDQPDHGVERLAATLAEPQASGSRAGTAIRALVGRPQAPARAHHARASARHVAARHARHRGGDSPRDRLGEAAPKHRVRARPRARWSRRCRSSSGAPRSSPSTRPACPCSRRATSDASRASDESRPITCSPLRRFRSLFPTRRVGEHYYCDGGLRFNTPIAPAIRAGAERLVVVSVRHARTPREIDAEEQADHGEGRTSGSRCFWSASF